ncbi:hypothetical protein LF1_50240 [Rubripirellula obstinata]|uniref:Pyrimidine/purine nucleoside phosphorylase n=1 Tax=Rubripirellula obstinata TaxID=406547 RepID=A0A5B1CS24_9BACT|nr:pyrimidine/purine nucleoside phosphorylase [Rubripirellula obstinata]KAA1262460.1 hypothetical protein LF1_50240 [Rubripirellula obstinata]
MQVNEYFEGRVMSIGFENTEGRATSGIMQVGEYEFGTSETELMKVTSGSLEVRLPGESEFKTYASGTEFNVEANVKFQVKVKTPTAYLCFYGG